MKTFAVVAISLLVSLCSPVQQQYTSSDIFAHNDYATRQPFTTAYQHRVGYIEADIFLLNDTLIVAHTKEEMNTSNTLTRLYLEPLAAEIRKNAGKAYPESNQPLTLMIDLKTAGDVTIPVLAQAIEQFEDILQCKDLYITVSGSMPSPDTWLSYPSFILFDGRPTIDYTADQLTRVHLISDSFRNYSSWNGQGDIPATEKQKLIQVLSDAHAKGKPFRFWGTPDEPNAWKTFMDMGIDVLNTDQVDRLSKFLETSAR